MQAGVFQEGVVVFKKNIGGKQADFPTIGIVSGVGRVDGSRINAGKPFEAQAELFLCGKISSKNAGAEKGEMAEGKA